MDTYTRETHSADETRNEGARYARELRPGTVVALAGDLGAGKSTFVQGLLGALGAEPPFPSPTFVIMHQYDLPKEQNDESTRGSSMIENQNAGKIRRVYHVDAYRVDGVALQNIGWEEWISDPQGVVLVEWPERVADILPERTRHIVFTSVDETTRCITIEATTNE